MRETASYILFSATQTKLIEIESFQLHFVYMCVCFVYISEF